MTIVRRTLLVGALLLVPVVPSRAEHPIRAGDLTIDAPWTRATPAGARAGGGYMTIRNVGTEPDSLIGGTFEIAGRVEIHEMAMNDGVMRMRELPDGLPIPPGGAVELKPGGFHVMFLGLERPLRSGETLSGTLRFRRAGDVPVTYRVGVMGAGPDGQPHRH